MHFLSKNIRNTLIRLFQFAESFLFIVSPVPHMLSTERRRHDVHVLSGDDSYDVRSVHYFETIK